MMKIKIYINYHEEKICGEQWRKSHNKLYDTKGCIN